jgi:hypothetical protein
LTIIQALALCLTLTGALAEAKQQRSEKAKREFKVQQPCPATGQTKGACPGYIIDHIVPLCAGGEDSPSNMQWQTVEDAKVKNKEEWKQCRELRNTGRQEQP